MANPPSKKTPVTGAKNAPARPPAKKPARKGSGRPAGLFTWILVGVVVVAVLAIVIVKITNGSSRFVAHPISSTMETQLTQIPQSVFDTVGITSPAEKVVPLPTLKNQAPLHWADASGVKRPTFFYAGAEFCPYCAAERWPIIVALSRFGTWSNLYTMLSSATDVYANTPTFTFVHATYTSSYLNFSSVETEDRDHNKLQTPSSQQLAVWLKYDPNRNIPFGSINNQTFIVVAQPSPSAYIGISRDQVAEVLNDPTNPLTQGIIAEANFISAGLCHMDGMQPATVCTSSGVKVALTKLGYA